MLLLIILMLEAEACFAYKVPGIPRKARRYSNSTVGLMYWYGYTRFQVSRIPTNAILHVARKIPNSYSYNSPRLNVGNLGFVSGNGREYFWKACLLGGILYLILSIYLILY